MYYWNWNLKYNEQSFQFGIWPNSEVHTQCPFSGIVDLQQVTATLDYLTQQTGTAVMLPTIWGVMVLHRC